MFFFKYAVLQIFGSIVLLNCHRRLRYNRAAVGNFVYEVNRTPRNLCAVLQSRFMNFQSVISRAAEGGNERRMNVYYSWLIFAKAL